MGKDVELVMTKEFTIEFQVKCYEGSGGARNCPISLVAIPVVARDKEEAIELFVRAVGRSIQKVRHQDWLDRHGG